MHENIEERVKNAAFSVTPVNPLLVKSSDSFILDHGFDSLDCIEALMAVEDEFGIEIRDDDAEKFNTVQDVIDYVRFKT